MALPSVILGARLKLRYDLGFRPETRMDEIVFRDGTVIKELPNGTFVGVRRGLHPWEDGNLRWL
jgi:hypothetical protein